MKVDTEFDKVYHQKVASEDHDEVVLLTKKHSSSKLFSQNNPVELIQLTDDHEPEPDNLNVTDNAKKSPQYRIEFNENNKIEMVPLVKPNSEKKQSQLKSSLSTESDSSQAETQLLTEYLKKSQSFEIMNAEDELEPFENQKMSLLLPPKIDSIRVMLENDLPKSVSLARPEIEVIQIEDDRIDERADSDDDDEDDGIYIQLNFGFHFFLNFKKFDFYFLDFVEVIECVEKTLPPKDLIKEVNSVLSSQMVRSSQPLKRKSQSPPPAKPSQPTNQPSQQAAFIVVYDEATAESAELAEEYNAFLANERNEILREKQANERLSHSLENHVIEEAKVILNLLIAPGGK